MNYKVYKLKFTTPVRFSALDNQGVLFNSDFVAPASLLYSALYITTLELQDNDLKEYFETDNFLLSDLLPYIFEDLYIPKPIIQFISNDNINRKKMKNLKYIPISMLNNYFNNPTEIIEEEESKEFGYFTENIKVAIKQQEDKLPYSIETFTFVEDCGLYFITNVPSHLEEKFQTTLKLLGLTGIGGKKSSGYGKFIIEEITTCPILNNLIEKESKHYMTLSTFIPQEKELPIINEGTYLLNIKNGFTYSQTYSKTPIKKENKLTIQKGSCFKQKLKGQLYKEQNGNHPIYTYGRPLMIGFDINE